MFTLKNKYGNILKHVETDREKEALLDIGYELVAATTETEFDKMKVSELEVFAGNNGIDLSECKNREEKLSKIKEFISK